MLFKTAFSYEITVGTIELEDFSFTLRVVEVGQVEVGQVEVGQD